MVIRSEQPPLAVLDNGAGDIAESGFGSVDDDPITCYLDDNSQAWELQADGSYRRLEPNGTETRRAQEVLIRRLTNGPAKA